jgi:hypothetical protein|nr:MAG TPA: hypothetical protein [Caudoviricetes sp.]DAR60514.1 MAG TPA: hypothetical protein [Caudoviricetes sp.]
MWRRQAVPALKLCASRQAAMFHGQSQRQHDMAKKALASKTGEVKYLQQGPVGPLVYPTGEYAASVSYTRTPLSAPMVLCEGQYYVLNKEGTFKNINPKKDYAANGSKATWVLMDKVRYSFVEILMANFAKLASAVFYGQYMFSQYGIKADGSAVETVGGYKDFNYNDPMNPANKFRPNLLLDFLTGSFKGRNVEVEGTIIANASFVRMHDFRANEGYFFLNPAFGSEFRNGRPNRISQSMYMLPEAVQYNGMKISLTIYNAAMGSTYGYTSVVTTDGFNELTFENNEYHYCNKIAISKSGVYEFMSLGAIWILTKGTDVAYSYAELEERTYEDPIN